MKPLTPQMQAAWDKTRAAYKALIRAPRRELPKWEHYGTVDACRMCIAAGFLGFLSYHYPDCEHCPLGPFYGCLTDDYEAFQDALSSARDYEPGAMCALRSAARARLKALTAKVEGKP